MGLFDRIKGFFVGEPKDTPKSASSGTSRVSPQGWSDDDPGWPASGHSPYAAPFPTPWDAVDALEKVFGALQQCHRLIQQGQANEAVIGELHKFMEFYAHTLQALYILDKEMGKRKGTYGRLAKLIVQHLDAIPFLLAHGLISMKLNYLGEDLGDSGAPELAAEGKAVSAAVSRARAVCAKSQSAGETTAEEANPTSTKSGELTPMGVMRILVEECAKDGSISDDEERLFLEMRALLRISVKDFTDMMASALQAAQATASGEEGDLDASVFFERLYREAMADGELSGEEDHLLSAVASYLSLSHEEVEAIRTRVSEGAPDDFPRLVRLQDEEARFDSESAEVAEKIHENGQMMLGRGNFRDAALRFERAATIYAKVHGEVHKDTAQSLNELGLACRKSERFDEAITHYSRALAIVEELEGSETEAAATVLSNLGVVYRNQKQYEQAKAMGSRARGIREQLLGKKHPDYGSSLNNLGALADEMGDHEEAVNFYSEAATIYRDVLGTAHPKVGVVLGNLGNAWAKLGQDDKARPCYEEALSILIGAFSKTHPTVAAPMVGLGALLQRAGDKETGEAFESMGMMIQMRL